MIPPEITCRPRTWGARCSPTDIAVLILAGGSALALARVQPDLALLIGFVTAHFFLFCNLIRLDRRSELIWAGVWVLNVAVWSLSGELRWGYVLLSQTPLTLFLTVAALRRPTYHGLGARRLNPHLDEYLSNRLP